MNSLIQNALIGLSAVGFAGTTAITWLYILQSRKLRQLPELTAQAESSVVAHRAVGALSNEYNTLLAHCGAGVLMLRSDDIIVRTNLTARYHLGVPTVNMLGKTLLQGTLSSSLHEIVQEARNSRCIQRRQITAPGSSGCILLAVATPVTPQEPDGCDMIVVVNDITELRRLETIRRDFVANVSHELRTPLTSIRAMAETLQDGALDDPSVSEHFLATIVEETVRLTRLAEDLLNLSHAESRSPEKQRFCLSTLCEEVVDRLAVQAQRSGVALTARLAPELEVTANHDQIEQVLVNLIDNAIKYTGAGGSVCITTQAAETGAIVHVQDTGIGLMSEDIPRIFERFYRVDRARSRQSGGTGLGLAIVKHIVEAHGGKVDVESEFNHGSTFTFTLPFTLPNR